MPEITLPADLQHWANDVLVWIGYGTLVGLLAKAIMPGRDPGGTVATLAMGIGGCVIGCGTLTFFYQGARVTPLSPTGFAVGTAGAFVLLLFYRLLAGRLFADGAHRAGHVLHPRYARRRGALHSTVIEE
jgi:uncharacterized membrane protein YeaQ/YmgE (transglycosylase-associated protein family)